MPFHFLEPDVISCFPFLFPFGFEFPYPFADVKGGGETGTRFIFFFPFPFASLVESELSSISASEVGAEEVGGNLDAPRSGVDGAVEALDLVLDLVETETDRRTSESRSRRLFPLEEVRRDEMLNAFARLSEGLSFCRVGGCV